jgi:hypothetical protein
MNSSGETVAGTYQYYDMDGTAMGSPKAFSIAAYASLPIYQGSDSLPAGFYGTTIVTQTSGAANSLISTANVQSDSFFYTYTEPTS